MAVEMLLSFLRKFPTALLEFMALVPALLAVIVQVWALIGLWFVFSCFLNVVMFVHAHFLRRATDLKRRFGKRVVIVGHFDDQLGVPLVHELSRRGHEVMAVSVSDSQRLAIPKSIARVVHIDSSWAHCTPDRLNECGKEIMRQKGEEEGVGLLVLLPPSPAASAPRSFSSLPADAASTFSEACAATWIPTYLTRLIKPRAVISITTAAPDMVTPQSALHGALSAFTARLSSNLSGSGECYSQRLVVLWGFASLLFGVPPSRMASLCCDAMGNEKLLAPHPLHAIVSWALRDLKMGPWLAWGVAQWELNRLSKARAKSD
jgi:hypothetical protein